MDLFHHFLIQQESGQVYSLGQDNYIFLPAAGYYYNTPAEETEDADNETAKEEIKPIHYFANEGGYYWAKELSLNNSSYAGYFHFYKDTRLMGYHERYAGQPIRAVVATTNPEE